MHHRRIQMSIGADASRTATTTRAMLTSQTREQCVVAAAAAVALATLWASSVKPVTEAVVVSGVGVALSAAAAVGIACGGQGSATARAALLPVSEVGLRAPSRRR